MEPWFDPRLGRDLLTREEIETIYRKTGKRSELTYQDDRVRKFFY